jgi:isopentenyl-diphosphate Delta-isomerase
MQKELNKMSEQYDILDETGSYTGVKASKIKAHKDRLIHRTVHVWILNKHHEILMQKRSLTEESKPGIIDIAVAGHINAGESSIHAVIREVNEELGIILEESEIKFLFTIDINTKKLNMNLELSPIHIDDVYIVRKDFALSDFKLNPEEVDSVKYFNPIELKQILLAGDKKFIDHSQDEYPMFFLWLENNVLNS